MAAPEQVAKDINALARDVLFRLDTASPAEINFSVQMLTRRVAVFIHQWGYCPTPEIGRSLDNAGTELWNRSITVRHDKAGDKEAAALLGAVRGAAALLVRGGTKDSDSLDDNARLVLVLSKAVMAICHGSPTHAEQMENAEELLSAAAERHEAMRKVEGYRSHRDALDSSQLVCLAKFDFARRKGTTQVAEWALDLAATEVETTPDKLSLNTVLRVAKVCLEYGTSLLARNDECRQNAVDWLRRSVKLLERIEGGTLPQIRETQAQALRKLARAFYQRSLSLQASDPDRNSYLDLADATITELQRVYRTFAPSLEYDQRLVLLRLNILGLRQAPCRQMLDLIDVLCSHTDGLSHDAVGCVLALLRSRPAAENDFIGKVLEELLRKVLADQPEEVETIEKIVLTILTLCKNSAMLGTTRSLLEQMDTAHFRASRDGSFAAQMLLWKYADAHLQLQSPDRMTAATLFQLAAHPIFSAADRNAAKSIRRASLCYLEAGETALANEVLLSCPSSAADDALNHHLRFNVFAKLGQEDHAMAAFNALLGAPNFRSSLLPSIVETAQKAGLEKVLYQALRDIADRAQGDASLAGEIDLVVLTRSLIKQCLSDDKMQRIDAVAAESLLQHFTNNLGALRDAAMKDSQDKKACQEAQWSYKTAYNTAIAMSSRVDPDLSAKFFDLALSLAKVREELIAEPVEVPSFQTIKVWAKLPAIVARSMIVREQKKIPQDPEQRVLWFKIKDETMEGFKLVEDAQKAAQSNDLLKEVVWSLVLLQYEAIVNLQDWTAASQCFHDHVAHGKLPVAILEAMADLTWGDPTAPDELLTGLLKANIDAARSRLADPPSSKSSQPDLPRLARWTRALISYTLTNKTMSGSTVAGDGRLSLSLRGAYMEALTHIEDTVRLLGDAEKIAASVLREYPSDEMSWLIATAWDTGVELYNCGDFSLSRAFCEAAITFSKLCAETSPSAKAHLEQMETEYNRLLTQLESGEAASNAVFEL